MEKTVNENRDRLPSIEVGKVEIRDRGGSRGGEGRQPAGDPQCARRAREGVHTLAEQLYKQQAAAPGAQASEKDDNVKDGEVVDA